MTLELAPPPPPKKPKTLDMAAMGFTAEEAKYLAGLRWQMVMHMNAHGGNSLVHAVEALGIERGTFTPKTYRHKDDWMGTLGASVTKYFVQGEKEPFQTFAEALACVRDKHRERITKAMRDGGFEIDSVPPKNN